MCYYLSIFIYFFPLSMLFPSPPLPVSSYTENRIEWLKISKGNSKTSLTSQRAQRVYFLITYQSMQICCMQEKINIFCILTLKWAIIFEMYTLDIHKVSRKWYLFLIFQFPFIRNYQREKHHPQQDKTWFLACEKFLLFLCTERLLLN